MAKPPSGITVTSYVEKIANLQVNELNPRKIDQKAFKALVKSLKDFPEMKELREIVVDENLVILGGHQRIYALKELGYQDVLVKKVVGLTEKQKREFIIKDNASSGEWDSDIMANLWDVEELAGWGVPKFNLGGIEADEEKPAGKEPRMHTCPDCGFQFSDSEE